MGKFIDLKGLKFGKLTVIEKTTNPNSKSKRTFWKCKCDCGKESIVSTTDLKSGKTQQCWDCAHIDTGSAKRKDLTGQRFGKLTVLNMIYGRTTSTGKKVTYCNCICDCGNKVEILVDNLKRKGIHSCGCARKEIADKMSKDIIGMKFGRLTVKSENKDVFPRTVDCLCECGNTITVVKTDVMSGHTKSCGCLQREVASSANTKDWSGYISQYGVKAIKQSRMNNKGQWLWEYECPHCGKTFETLPARVASGGVTSCGCNRQSSGEYLIEQILYNEGLDYKTEYAFEDCKYKHRLRFDFAVFDLNQNIVLLIEYDGKQHYEPIEFFGGLNAYNERKIRDNIKNDYCVSNGIPLLRIKYNLSPQEIKTQILNAIYP